MRTRVLIQLLDTRKVSLYLDDNRRVGIAPDELRWTLYRPWDDVRGEVIDRCCCVVLGEEQIR